MKKQQQLNKGKQESGVATEKRMDRDADIMRQKQQKAAEKAQAGNSGQQGSKVVTKYDPLK